MARMRACGRGALKVESLARTVLCGWPDRVDGASEVRAALHDRSAVRADELAVAPRELLGPADLTRVCGRPRCLAGTRIGRRVARRWWRRELRAVGHASTYTNGGAIRDLGRGGGARSAGREQHPASFEQHRKPVTYWRTRPYVLTPQRAQPPDSLWPSTVRSLR